jgi:hypothetical protein
MSDYQIGVVAEGPTDRIVIEAALQAILQGRAFTVTQLQPDTSDALANGGFGRLGAGWGGVYQWCRQIFNMGENLASHPALNRFDLIILHLDADVAEKKYGDAGIADPVNDDLPCVKPCPPAEDSVAALRQVVLGWLGLNAKLPRPFVFCIPSKCTECWVFVALYGQSHSNALTDIECDPDVARYLAQKPAKERLIRIKDKKTKKMPNRYSEQSDRISRRWGYVADICRQAYVFDMEVAAVLT